MVEPYFFISYSRKQYFIAKKLAESLQERRLSVWLDVERISPGDDWQATIDQGLEQCRALVLVATPAAYRSGPVRYEVEAARKAGKPIYLLVLETNQFTKELAGVASMIDCRGDFVAAAARLAQSLSSGQRPVERVERSRPLSWLRLPLGQVKMTQLALLNACFLLGSIALPTRIQITIHWPIEPRVAPYVVLALALIALWFVSFGYSIFLLFAFRYQWRVTFQELDLWPTLCVFLLPMLYCFLGLRFNTAQYVQVPGFGSFFNTYFSIQYRSDWAIFLFAALTLGVIGLFYLYLRHIYLGGLLDVPVVICAILVMASTSSAMYSVIGILIIGGGIAIWMLRETLTGKTIPITFGARDQRLARLHELWPRTKSVWDKNSSASDTERAWGYWLSPGAFSVDPLAGTRSAAHAAPAATRGATWRLHYLPADRRCAQRIRQILASQPGISEAPTGEASYEIAILSNRTPRRWIDDLAVANPHLMGIMISSIDTSALPDALHQNQWIDYRRQQPAAIRRLGAVIAGMAEPIAPTTPEDFVRSVGPFPLHLVSHALRISGVAALTLAAAALLIWQALHAALIPTPLIAFCFVLGVWDIWAGSRILARRITFAELCALVGLNVLNAAWWASQGGIALLPRSLRVSAGPYNGSLTSGIGFVLALIALPLVLFLLFGWVELLLHLRTFLAWLPGAAGVSLGRTLAVQPWRQLDFAYIPYLLSCLILIATLVGDSPARFTPIQEFDLPDQNTKIVSFISGPDQNVWFATYTFSVTSNQSGQQVFQQDAMGYVTPDGTMRASRFILPKPPYCSAIITEVCPVFFGKDGSLAYLSRAQLGVTRPPSLTWLTAAGKISAQSQLPADALVTTAVFDGAGNLWYMREVSKTEVAIGRLDRYGQVTAYPYQPSTDLVAGRDGSVWLTDRATGSLIHIGADGAITRYAVPHLETDVLTQLAPGPDGTAWFYELHGGIVGHLALDGEFTFRPTDLFGAPVQLLVGAHNTAWLLAPLSNAVEYLPPSGPARSFSLEQPSNTMEWLTVGGDGNLYFSLRNQLGRVTQRGDQRLYEVPTLDAEVEEVVAGPDGRLWFSEIPQAGSKNWSLLGVLAP